MEVVAPRSKSLMSRRYAFLLLPEVGGRYGLNLHRDDLDGLTKIYGQFLEALIPSGGQQDRACAYE
jgi:hypothetical protein